MAQPDIIPSWTQRTDIDWDQHLNQIGARPGEIDWNRVRDRFESAGPDADEVARQISANDPVQQWWRQQQGFNPEQEAMGAIGPNARSILNYQNDPSATRPAARSGWPTRFAGLGAERAARREEDTRTAYSGLRPATVAGDKSPEELAEDVRGARLTESGDMIAERMRRGLPTPIEAPTEEEQQQGMSMPMTTHGGRAGTMVSALPRPLDRVEAELRGEPNFDRAAGPQNEQWQAARDRRDARREEAREAITEREARKADNRRRRLEQRREPPRPATAGGMGALWNVDPVAAARIAQQQQMGQAQIGNQQQRMAQQGRQFDFERERWETEREDQRPVREMQAEMAENYSATGEQIKELGQRIAALDPADPERKRLVRERRELEERQESLGQSLNQAQRQGGPPSSPQTLDRGEPMDITRTDEESYDYLDDDSVIKQALGPDFNAIDPVTAAETLASWKQENPNSRVPADDELDAIIPKLRSAEIDSEAKLRRGQSQNNAIIASAHPMYEGEKVEAARKRVKAAMDYFGKPPEKRGDPPEVNGYRMKKHEETHKRKNTLGGPRTYRTYRYTWEKAD